MRRARGQSGQVIPLVGLALVGILIVAAIVVDLGQLRTDRQTNKRLTDSAVTAAVQDLETSPWKAVCTAYRYTLTNATFGSFASETWSDQASPTPIFTTSTTGCPTSGVSYTAACTSDPSTWAHFHGIADGGKITVDIESAYTLPDPAFAEDASISSDNGQPCDQVAEIVTQQRATVFGPVAGASSGRTTTRSVARIDRGPGLVGALVVLERTDCGALVATTNGGEVWVKSTGETPGAINVDSDGTTNCSSSQAIVQGSPIPLMSPNPATGGTGGPNIVAQPTTSGRSGRISIFGIGSSSNAYSSACPYSSPSSTCTIMPVPTRGPRLGRTFLDQRYLQAVRNHVTAANSAIASPPSDLLSTDLTNLSDHTLATVTGGRGNQTCTINGTVIISDASLYIDCALKVSNGGWFEDTAAGAVLVAQSTITVDGSTGSSGYFVIDRPAALYVVGVSGSQSLNINGNFVLNTGSTGINASTKTVPGCPAASAGNPTSVMVVQDGFLSASGGTSTLFQLCQTSVIMASGFTTTSGPAWPTAPGAPPYNNCFTGTVRVGAQGTVDWSAPNAVPNGPASQSDWNNLEDLTLWTETSGVAPRGFSCGPSTVQPPSIGGQGSLILAGVFALPNAVPFTISGSGSQRISADAQFWTRELALSGQAVLEMAPNPNDSIPIFNFVLVR